MHKNNLSRLGCSVSLLTLTKKIIFYNNPEEPFVLWDGQYERPYWEPHPDFSKKLNNSHKKVKMWQFAAGAYTYNSILKNGNTTVLSAMGYLYGADASIYVDMCRSAPLLLTTSTTLDCEMSAGGDNRT